MNRKLVSPLEFRAERSRFTFGFHLDDFGFIFFDVIELHF